MEKKILEYQENDVAGKTIVFNTNDIEEVVREIENEYSNPNDNPLSRASSNKWKEGTTAWDGKMGYHVTAYFWVDGKNIRKGLDVVASAQRRAINSVYRKIEDKYQYKMETTQHITQSAVQTQGMITVSAKAKCHGRRTK